MAGLSFTWTLQFDAVGWAVCTIADEHGQAEASASDVTGGPEYLLRAITSLVRGAAEARAEFEAEGPVFRWFFRRDGIDAKIRLVEAPDSRCQDSDSVYAFAEAIVDGFDRARSELGEDAYRAQWGRAFPHADVEALRAAQLAGER
jgi:hypothetical protein